MILNPWLSSHSNILAKHFLMLNILEIWCKVMTGFKLSCCRACMLEIYWLFKLKITVRAQCIIDKLFVFNFFFTWAWSIDWYNSNSNETYDFLTSMYPQKIDWWELFSILTHPSLWNNMSWRYPQKFSNIRHQDVVNHSVRWINMVVFIPKQPNLSSS